MLGSTCGNYELAEFGQKPPLWVEQESSAIPNQTIYKGNYGLVQHMALDNLIFDVLRFSNRLHHSGVENCKKSRVFWDLVSCWFRSCTERYHVVDLCF